MTRVSASVQIDVPPQKVFDTVMDPARLKDWVTIHRSVQSDGAEPCQGATMDQVLVIRGVSFTVHWTLASVTNPNEAQWEGRGPAGTRALIRYCIDGPDEGPTTFEYTNEFSTPGGPLGRRASKLVMGGVSEREAERSLAKLKSLMEG